MCRKLLITGVWLGLLCASRTFAAVIYTATPDLGRWPEGGFGFPMPGIGSWPPFPDSFAAASWQCDFDGDSEAEVLISSLVDGISAGGVFCSPSSFAEILSAPLPPPFADPEGLAVGLLGGDAIESDTPSLFAPATGVKWGGADFRTGVFNMLSAVFDSGQAGTFYGEIRYLGVRFQTTDGWHYGWIAASGGPMGLNVYGYAWETEAGKSIAAGAIPEPGGGWLAASAMAIWLLKRRRVLRTPSSAAV